MIVSPQTHLLSGILIEVTHHGVERARQVNIVAVDESENVSSRFFESLVDRMHLPAIFFTHPVSKTVFVATNNRNAFVSAAAVDHDVLERLVSLLEHGQDRLFQETALVEGRRDDAEFQSHAIVLAAGNS